jgi:glycosyltransferase involved in cell wall biosynthesis
MSVYNSEKYLKKSIESILNQSFTDFEFIIINDKSSDKSEKILDEFAQKDERIKLYTNEKNLGLTKSLNIALRLAKGKYIARMDADDISFDNRFQSQFEFLENDKSIFLLGSWAVEIDEMGKEKALLKPVKYPKDISRVLAKQNTIIHPSIMFRNEGNNFYREKFKYAQDYDFYLCLLSKGKQFANFSEVLIKYRISKSSISIQKNTQQRLFTQKANFFYHEREEYNKDSYDFFEPIDILSGSLINHSNRIGLQSDIYMALKFFDEKLIRNSIKKYFKNYGFFNKFLLYYIISYFGKDFYLKIRKNLSL